MSEPSELALSFARDIVAAEGFYTRAAVCVAKELLRVAAELAKLKRGGRG